VTRIRGLLDKDSNDLESWLGLGDSLLDLQRPGEAADALRRVIELDPEHTAAHRELGRALLESGNPVEAAEMFARAIGLAEKDGDQHTGRDIHVYLRQFDKLP
jgi:cytochrome c-type biogenesis protein CcmH/NrfG